MESGNVVEHEGYKYLYLKDTFFSDYSAIAGFDATIIQCTDADTTAHIMEMIRGDENEAISLKPIFLHNKKVDIKISTNQLIDGEILKVEEFLPSLHEIVHEISEAYKQLPEVNSINFESYLITKALRFFYIRGKSKFIPVHSRSKKIGYAYPIFSLTNEYTEGTRVLDLLKSAEKNGYIAGTFMETVHVCNQCANAFLHYREICPKCESSNLDSEDLVHHFPCAYIGPITDFSNQFSPNEMHCPKCNKELKHIGVDYDKPSVIYSCNNCEHTFQDITVKAKCVSCGHDSEVEHLAKRKVKKFEITGKGKFGAVHGANITHRDINNIPGSVDMETFTIMLQYEVERLKVASVESSIGFIHLNNVSDLYGKIGKDSKFSLLSDLVQIVRGEIRSSDIITFEDTSTILFSLIEHPLEESRDLVRKIGIIIKKVIHDNFKGFHPDISFGVHELDASINYKEQINDLNKEIFHE